MLWGSIEPMEHVVKLFGKHPISMETHFKYEEMFILRGSLVPSWL